MGPREEWGFPKHFVPPAILSSSALRRFPWMGPNFLWDKGMQFKGDLGEDKTALLASAFRPGDDPPPAKGQASASSTAAVAKDVQSSAMPPPAKAMPQGTSAVVSSTAAQATGASTT